MILAIGIAAGALAAGFLADANAPPGGGPTIDVAPVGHLDIAARYFAFSPSTITLVLGAPTEIRAVNGDVALHTFTYVVNGTTYSHELRAGDTTSFVVLAGQPGTIPFWCQLHSRGNGASGMVGSIAVK